MARRLRTDADGDQSATLRARLLAHYREQADRWGGVRLDGSDAPPRRNTHAELLVEQIEAGGPVVLPGWALRRHVRPGGVVRRSVYAFYRVESDGRVVEVSARRDPTDPSSIIDWDEV